MPQVLQLLVDFQPKWELTAVRMVRDAGNLPESFVDVLGPDLQTLVRPCRRQASADGGERQIAPRRWLRRRDCP